MTIRKLSAKETEALLTELSERDCGQGCKCVFCRTFEAGVESGMHDAAIHFERVLEEMKREIGA